MGSSSTPTHPTSHHHHHGVYWALLGCRLEGSGTCAAAAWGVMDAISMPATSNGLSHYVHMGAGQAFSR